MHVSRSITPIQLINMFSFSPRREKEEERIYVSEINQISDLIISQYPSLRFTRLGKKTIKKRLEITRSNMLPDQGFEEYPYVPFHFFN